MAPDGFTRLGASMQTQRPAGHVDAVKAYTVSTFGRIARAPGWFKNLTGPAQTGQVQAQDALEGRSTPTMPVVRISALANTPGDKASVTLFDTLKGSPIMGNRNLEGNEQSLESSSQDIRLDEMGQGVDAGKRMDQKRIVTELLPMAESALAGWFPKAYNQLALIHVAGSRGTRTGGDWVIPLASDANFDRIAVNRILAPSYNRHLVIDGPGFAGNNGAGLGSIDSGDVWTLDHIDYLALLLNVLDVPLQPVIIPGDRAAMDKPIKAVLFLTPAQMNQFTTQNSGRTWADMVKMAYARKSSMSEPHPLFDGEPGLWKGILIKEMPVNYVVGWNPGDTTRIVTEANRYTGTESDQTVNGSLGSSYQVERALLMGGQALGFLEGGLKSNNYWFELKRRKYDYDRGNAIGGFTCMGMQKLRFTPQAANGQLEPTDHGVIVVDSAVKKISL